MLELVRVLQEFVPAIRTIHETGERTASGDPTEDLAGHSQRPAGGG